MPEPEQEATAERQAGELNEHQKARLRITCRYIDKLLGDVEDMLHAASSPSPFPRYIVDVNPAQIRVLEDYIRRFRSQLVRTIAWQDMKPEPPEVPARRAILATLTFIDIAAEELKPSYMRGYGPVPEGAIKELNGVVEELRSLVTGMEQYLKQEQAGDLEGRLRRLESAGLDTSLLRVLDQIVARDGMVEFRSRIDSLTARMEEDKYEIALFGRVSSGKSSLLNALLGADVLPVGVNPITAVPTKLRFGPELKAVITYGDGRSEAVSVEGLAHLVTEQGNPGNLRNVVRAMVDVPSTRLRKGVLLVDTPGLGSLAQRGTAETLAYLPSCDLALLMIDAGAPPNAEDIGTLRLLYEAGIPALVLLSKADLLAEGDLHHAITYIQEHVKSDLNLDVAVHPVSAMTNYVALLDQFFERELLPRFQEARALREASTARKLGALREAMLIAMEVAMEHGKRGTQKLPGDTSGMESRLRVLMGEVSEQPTALREAFQAIGEAPDRVLEAVSQRAVDWVRIHPGSTLASLQLSEWLHDAVAKSVDVPIGALRQAGEGAIESLQSMAREMGRSDAPSQREFDLLLRDLPRFEMAALPASIQPGRWKLLGEGVMRSRARNSLRDSIGEQLRQEMRLYGSALARWGDEVVRKLEALLNSYVDTYRAQLHRAAEGSDRDADLSQLKADVELLAHWKGTSAASVERIRA